MIWIQQLILVQKLNGLSGLEFLKDNCLDYKINLNTIKILWLKAVSFEIQIVTITVIEKIANFDWRH